MKGWQYPRKTEYFVAIVVITLALPLRGLATPSFSDGDSDSFAPTVNQDHQEKGIGDGQSATLLANGIILPRDTTNHREVVSEVTTEPATASQHSTLIRGPP